MEDFYIINMVDAIYTFSSFEFQKEVWTGKSKKYVSSYTEALCVLYDDCSFETFFLKEIKNYGYSKNLIDLFNLLNNKIKEFEKDEEHDTWENVSKVDKFWKDEQWIEISQIAKSVLVLWRKEDDVVEQTLSDMNFV